MQWFVSFAKRCSLPESRLQLAFGRPRAFGLQLGPQAAVTKTHVVDMAGRVNGPIRINGDILHAQIHPKRLLHVNRLGFFHFAGSREKEQAAIQPQVTIRPAGSPAIPAGASPQTNGIRSRPSTVQIETVGVFHAPRQYTVIVGDTAQWLESALGFGSSL